MGRVTTIGLDIAKSVFQVHGIDAGCEVVLRRRVMRARLLAFFAKLAPCLIGIEACATFYLRELLARTIAAMAVAPPYPLQHAYLGDESPCQEISCRSAA
jgi:transposase